MKYIGNSEQNCWLCYTFLCLMWCRSTWSQFFFYFMKTQLALIKTQTSNFYVILRTFELVYFWPLTKSKEPGKNIWISLKMSHRVMNKRPFSCPLHSMAQQKGLEAQFPKFICAISFQCLILFFSAGWWQRQKMEHFFPVLFWGLN